MNSDNRSTTTPSYSRLTFEDIQKKEIETYEATIKILEKDKKNVAKKLTPLQDDIKQKIQTTQIPDPFLTNQLSIFVIPEEDPLWTKKIGDYLKKVKKLHENPQQTSVNTAAIRTLSSQLDLDISATQDNPAIHPLMKQLKKFTDLLRIKNEMLVSYKKTEAELASTINDYTQQIDEKIAKLHEEIMTLKGGELRHLATYQRDFQGKFHQTK